MHDLQMSGYVFLLNLITSMQINDHVHGIIILVYDMQLSMKKNNTYSNNSENTKFNLDFS